MLATLGALPPDPEDWGFEFKWDGVRALVACNIAGNEKVQIIGRSGADFTARYPELHGLARAVGARAIFDGEIVALDTENRPSFGLLQRRMHVTDPRQASRLSASVPVWYVLFDVLYLNGQDLRGRPYRERRKILEELTVAGPSWNVTPAQEGDGVAMLEVARQGGLEGLVAKRLDSIYETGRRSPNWLKIKIVASDEFVVGGWLPERGGTSDRVGALLVGYYDCHGKLRYAGNVGSGLAVSDQETIAAPLLRRPRSTSPFSDPLPIPRGRGVRFVEPDLVAEIEYRRWPTDGLLQQPAFKGWRADKSASEVVMSRCGEEP